ncbi:hypothetical protein [Streptomyces sp. ISL-10]|uniref:hypothetical protein n=1 Tax=Streptomyces sp. ISL-10 TaxID=2819172 RepID=UPI002036433C|nr:hypothetical protein [Streptomyces sp. ISL-10]
MTTAGAMGRMRRALGLGRLVALGGPEDGTWLAERAAGSVLIRAAAKAVRGAAVTRLDVRLADPETAAEPMLPPPPSALPPGSYRLSAQVAVWSGEPLPEVTAALRSALSRTAADRLGLVVGEVDLRVVELPDSPLEPAPTPSPTVVAPSDAAGTTAAATAGVVGLTAELSGRAVHLADDHVRIELATAEGFRALDVARAVRASVSGAMADGRPVTVLISSVA